MVRNYQPIRNEKDKGKTPYPPSRRDIMIDGRYFKLAEFMPDKMIKDDLVEFVTRYNELRANSINLMHSLDIIRELYGSPITVTSGLRLTIKNRQVGGAENSMHRDFKSADLRCDDIPRLYNQIINGTSDYAECFLSIKMDGEKEVVSWIHYSYGSGRKKGILKY